MLPSTPPRFFTSFEHELRDFGEREDDTCICDTHIDERIMSCPTNEMGHVPNDNTRLRITNNDAGHVISADDGVKGKHNGNTNGNTNVKGKKGGEGETKEKKKWGKKGVGSKSGKVNQCTPGTLDEEIEVLNERESMVVVVVVLIANTWDNSEKLKMMKYICSEEIWLNFMVQQGEMYIQVSRT